MAYNPVNPNGQATAANSAPVVLASNVTSSFSVAEAATGGADTRHIVTALGNNVTQVKAGAGKVTGWYIYNSNGSSRKVNFYNVLSPAPTVGTTTILLSVVIPALSAANCPFPAGINFDTGIYLSTTSGLPDNDAGTVAANDLIINILYK